MPNDGPTPQTIGFQLAMAFGQGAGTLLATGQALMAAFQPYQASIDDKAPNWNQYALQAIEYSRALGQVAAFSAATNGRCVIDVADVTYALGVVQRNTLYPLGICSITSQMQFRGGKAGA